MYITDNVMVCVTQQKNCERLIQRGADLRNEVSGELYVIHVAREGASFLGNQKEAEALEYLFNISKGVGAELTVLRSKSIVDTLVDFAETKGIGHIVLGEPPADCREDSVVFELKQKLSSCRFYVMPANELKL